MNSSPKLKFNLKILGFVLLVFAIFYYVVERPDWNEKVSQILKYATDETFMTSDKAITERNSSLCDQLSDENPYKDNCYRETAIFAKDISLCTKGNGTYEMAEECKITLQAILNKNPQICDRMNDTIESPTITADIAHCYLHFAVSTRNFTACDEVLTLNDKFSYAAPFNDFKDGCYAMAANLMLNSTFCNNVEDNKIKNFCIAISTLTTDECDALTNKYWCYSIIALTKKDLAMCDLIPQDPRISNYTCAVKIENNISQEVNFIDIMSHLT
jgi:hypothetical protein